MMSSSSDRLRWLVRHGESAANAGGVTHDPASIPLSPRGEAQARNLVARLPRPPDLIVHSPFLRTRQTAAPTMARYPEVPVETWPIQEFTYLSPKRCVGTTAIERRPWVEAYWNDHDPEHVDGEGAESFAAMLERIRSLRDRLATSKQSFVLVFAHGQIMQALRMIEAMPEASDLDIMSRFAIWDRARPIANVEVIVIEGDAGRP